MILDHIYILFYKYMNKNNSKHALLNASMTLVILETFTIYSFFAYARLIGDWQIPDKRWGLVILVAFTVINYLRYESKEKTNKYELNFDKLKNDYKRRILYGTIIYILVVICIPLILAILEFNFGISLKNLRL